MRIGRSNRVKYVPKKSKDVPISSRLVIYKTVARPAGEEAWPLTKKQANILKTWKQEKIDFWATLTNGCDITVN